MGRFRAISKNFRFQILDLTFCLNIIDLVVLLACLVTFWHGWRATYDLDWPPGTDLYRDTSIAQTMLDGGGLADPAYLGERLWYNPLVPALVAGISWLTRGSAPITYARVGAYLNLLAPICFYLMLAYLFRDRLIAGVSTLTFLFVTCQYPFARACATYSPWLFAAVFTQAVFYLTLTTYEWALRRSRWRDFIWTGLLLGVTFLGHTAPALILGGIIIVCTAATAVRRADRTLASSPLRDAVIRLGIVFGAALVVSAPYLRNILVHYRLHILNPAPSSWTALELKNISTLIRANLSLPSFVALIGLITLWVRPRDRLSYLLTPWLIVCLGFIGLGYATQTAARLGLSVPSIVPSIHFLFYLKALVSTLFGYGLLTLIHLTLTLGKKVLRNPTFLRRRVSWPQVRVERTVLVLVTLVTVLMSYGPFVRHSALVENRQKAQAIIPPDWRNAYVWIREHTAPSDVFLAPPDFGLHVVTPAGRKVVALAPVFSNPYVDATTRLAHNSLMFEYLVAGDVDRFAVLASSYRVRYVVKADNSPVEVGNLPLQPAFTGREITIYSVSLPPLTP
jgi:hypothetical protein